ncbi:uncharacterized protein EMH_0048050 [Eimeria mitis]|uniref:Translation elongation factor KOW-like domain-containing protein n=1 Tax=Eimeria mitis TaxID=44415 RepID=U6JUU6_9EIME|nr:uncharacterized protein EMH_0048050 [Eimeria mitis]CDJ29240.1 hypothetical protein, conserved [Eimeria mitis]
MLCSVYSRVLRGSPLALSSLGRQPLPAAAAAAATAAAATAAAAHHAAAATAAAATNVAASSLSFAPYRTGGSAIAAVPAAAAAAARAAPAPAAAAAAAAAAAVRGFASITANEARQGNLLLIDGRRVEVTEFRLIKSGRGAASVSV